MKDIEKKIITMKSPWEDNEEYKLVAVQQSYSRNGRLCVELFDIGNMEDFADLTVNITFGYSTEGNNSLALVDTNNNDWAVKMLEDSKLAKPTGKEVAEGFCLYPEYEFDMTKLVSEKELSKYLEEKWLESELEDEISYSRREVEREFGLENGELDAVDIREAERRLNLENGELDRFVINDEKIKNMDDVVSYLNNTLEANQSKYEDEFSKNIVDEMGFGYSKDDYVISHIVGGDIVQNTTSVDEMKYLIDNNMMDLNAINELLGEDEQYHTPSLLKKYAFDDEVKDDKRVLTFNSDEKKLEEGYIVQDFSSEKEKYRVEKIIGISLYVRPLRYDDVPYRFTADLRKWEQSFSIVNPTNAEEKANLFNKPVWDKKADKILLPQKDNVVVKQSAGKEGK